MVGFADNLIHREHPIGRRRCVRMTTRAIAAQQQQVPGNVH
jgi:hypothetical protein